MPFVKRDAGPPQTPAGEPEPGLAIGAIDSPDAQLRWNAVRALGSRPEAVPTLAAALVTEQVARVREAIMTALMRIGDSASVAALLPELRSPDAGRRGAAIEVLQALPDAVAPFVTVLLGDSDTDVRILAVELVRGMPDEKATALLCSLLEVEPHPNVCAAAVDVLAEVGTRAALPALHACARRFATVPFLPFAIATAIARVSDAEG